MTYDQTPKGGSYMRKLTACILSVSLALAMLTGCSTTEKKEVDTSIHVDTQEAQLGKLEVESSYIASVAAASAVNVVPMVSGTVKKVNVKPGDKVKEGDVLCKFDDTAAQFNLDSANATVNSAQAGKKAADAQTKAAKDQAQASIDGMQSTVDGYNSSLADAEKQLKAIEKNESAAKSALEAAKSALTTTKTAYKTAQNLQVNWQAFLTANPDCATTSGLAMAAAGDPAEEKTAKASQLLTTLTGAGLTVEYITDSGISTLKGNADDAQTAFDTASKAYAELQSGKTQLQASIKTLKAQIKATKKSLSSAKKSANTKVGTDVYDAQIGAAQVGVDAAKYQLDLYTIKAPMDGIIETVNVKEKEMFATGYAAFTIAGSTGINVTFYVTEDAKSFIKPGDALTAEHNGKEHHGTVTTVSQAADAQRGLFKVEGQVYLDSSTKISSGVNIKINLVTAAVNDTIIIPYDAVYYDNDQAYVYIASNGTANRQDITTGLYNDQYIAVTDGLEEGDQVITTWTSGLKNGAKIGEESK